MTRSRRVAMRWARPALGVALAGHLSGCAEQPAQASPPPTAPTTPGSPSSPAPPSPAASIITWSVELPPVTAVSGMLLGVAAGRAVLADTAAVWAVALSDGATAWVRPTGAGSRWLRGYNRIATARGVAFVSNSTDLLAYDAASSNLPFVRFLPDIDFLWSMAADDSAVYALTLHGGLAAMGAASGKTLWQTRLPSAIYQTHVNGTLIATGDTLFVALSGNGSQLIAGLDRKTGAMLSTRSWPSVTLAPPLVTGDVVVGVDDTASRVVALDRFGRPGRGWTVPLRAASGEAMRVPYGLFLAYQDRVFVAADTNTLSAIEARTGTLLWSTRIPSLRTMVGCGTSVIVIATDRVPSAATGRDSVTARVSKVDARTGTLLSTEPLPGVQFATGFPMAADSTTAVFSTFSRLYAVTCR